MIAALILLLFDKLQFVDLLRNEVRTHALSGDAAIFDTLQEVLIKLKVFKSIDHSRGAAKDM